MQSNLYGCSNESSIYLMMMIKFDNIVKLEEILNAPYDNSEIGYLSRKLIWDILIL